MTSEQQQALATRVNELVCTKIGRLEIELTEWRERATRAEAEVAELRAGPVATAKSKK